MRRRAASAIAALLACACAGGVIALSAHLRSERAEERERYRDARRELARSAARATAGGTEAGAAGSALCLGGVETAAVALADRAQNGALANRGRLDLEALADLSARASHIERRLERAGGLPQRLGRERDGAGGWRPLAPEATYCEGVASAPLHGVSFRSGAK